MREAPARSSSSAPSEANPAPCGTAGEGGTPLGKAGHQDSWRMHVDGRERRAREHAAPRSQSTPSDREGARLRDLCSGSQVGFVREGAGGVERESAVLGMSHPRHARSHP
jgi:hypothetical protein